MTENDIISRLNAVTEDSMYNEPWTTNQLCFEAAREIQKLRSALERYVGDRSNYHGIDMGHRACTALQTIGDAEAVVKRMLGRFGQALDDEELRAVAVRMVRTLPKPSI